jgi:O-antigen ligase
MMEATGSEMFQEGWLAGRVFRFLLLGVVLAGCALVALVYAVKWQFSVALVGFLTLLVANLYSLQLAVLPVFFSIPFDRLGRIGPESTLTVAKILVAVLILAWAAHLLVKRGPRPLAVLLHSPLFLLASLWLVFSFFSVINARDYDIFLAQNLRRVNNFMLFILITTIVDSKALLQRVLGILLLAYFFIGLTVLDEIATGQSILQTVWGEEEIAPEYTIESDTFRVAGPSGDPDFLAISVIFPTLLGLTLMFEPVPRLVKAFVLGVVLILTIAMLATGSRGGLGALLIGAGIFWFLTRMRYKYLIASVTVVILILTTVVLSVAGGVSSTERYTGESGCKSLVFRRGWTQMAVGMIQDHPFVGIGTGNFPKEYNRYSRTIPEVPRRPHWTHNSFLQTWAENGMFAFMVYAGVFVTSAGAMLRVIWRTTDPALRRLAVLMLSTVASYFFFAGTSNVLENENYWIVFALVTVVSFLAREETGRLGAGTAERAPA